MSNQQTSGRFSADEAKNIAAEYYGLNGEVRALPGELDYNFWIGNKQAQYILKISRPGADMEMVDYMEAILNHLAEKAIMAPMIVKNKKGQASFELRDAAGETRIVRLLTWIDGRLWSAVRPHTKALLHSAHRAQAQVRRRAVTDRDVVDPRKQRKVRRAEGQDVR